jgi:hypothetical protein
MKKTTKNLGTAGLWAEALPNTKQSVNHSATTFGLS